MTRRLQWPLQPQQQPVSGGAPPLLLLLPLLLLQLVVAVQAGGMGRDAYCNSYAWASGTQAAKLTCPPCKSFVDTCMVRHVVQAVVVAAAGRMISSWAGL